MARKYLYPDRAGYVEELARKEQELTMHRITLDAILRDEYAWTTVFRADNGSWFQMGIARASHAHGGVVLVREFYTPNNTPSQHARWADSWIRETGSWVAVCSPTDQEARTYRECFYAIRELQHRQANAA